MKKLLVILFVVLFSGSMYSQKVNIEKKTGVMSIDGKEVAKFSSTKNAEKQDVYTLTDLHSDDFVKLTMVKLAVTPDKTVAPGKNEGIFLDVSSSLSDKTSEMDFEFVNFTLNMNSAIANLIVKKYNFFTTEGMNRDAIVQFLNLESNKHRLAYEASINGQQETALSQLPEKELAVRAPNAQTQPEEYERRVHVEGILVLEDGKEMAGQFNADFRETPDGMVSQTGNIVSLDGKTLIYYYKDEKGKDKIKIYKEKDIRSFRVTKKDEPDYDEYYCTIEYVSEPGKADVATNDGLDIGALGKNLLGGSKPKAKKSFVYRAADMPNIALYFSGDKIFIMDKKNKKTIVLDKSRYEAQLKEIAKDCPAVLENIGNHIYKLGRNSIYSFVTAYNGCE